jgi:hypothetical protein
LSCGGEPTDQNFLNYNSITGAYDQRRRTLFNLYALGPHMSTRQQPPTLHIFNCDFEYFLASGYESLITIETNAISSTVAVEKSYGPGNTQTEQSSTHYVVNSADRAANVTILKSTFKTSRFCKGMIVYRPAFYDGQTNALLNYTNLYMTNPIKNGSNSTITIKDSTFTNMNALTQVKALALTGVSTVT